MHSPLIAIFCIVVAAAGWYYLFYSRAAERLGAVEPRPENLQRVRLRRVGGFVIMLLGATLYVGFFGVSWDPPTRAFATVWMLVFALLAAAVILAMADVYLTGKLRRYRQQDVRPTDPNDQHKDPPTT
jgi:Na+/H+ antiporter NhaD/arsenite permease-like protein